MTVELLAIACGFTFLAVLVLVPPVGQLARRVGAVALPRSDRWHRSPVPTIGGLAIGAGIILGGLAIASSSAAFVPYSLGVGVMTAVGLSDDLRGLRPRVRVLAEVIVGVGFVLAIPIDVAPWVFGVGVLVAAIAFPAAMNATNLVDNADGLAAGLSLVAGVVIAIGGLIIGVEAAVAAASFVASACAAFLVFNRPPARIFMGDSGSLSLGFALAAASTLLVVSAATVGIDATETAVAVVIAAWAVQSGDVLLVVVTRRRRGVPVWQGGTDHTSHRLMARGMSAGRMLLSLLGLAAGAGAIVLVAAIIGDGPLALGAAAIVLVVVAAFEAGIARINGPELVAHNRPDDESPDDQADGS